MKIPRKDSKRPPLDELARLASEMTVTDLAIRCEVSPSTAARWCSDAGIKCKREKRPQNYSAIERIVGTDPEAIRAWMRVRSIEQAMEVLKIDYVNTGRSERVYGARFLRTCKACGEAKPYEDMRQRANGMIYKICTTCWDLPKRPKAMRYKDEAHRPEPEVRIGQPWERVRMSGAEGINGYLRGMVQC